MSFNRTFLHLLKVGKSGKNQESSFHWSTSLNSRKTDTKAAERKNEILLDRSSDSKGTLVQHSNFLVHFPFFGFGGYETYPKYQRNHL